MQAARIPENEDERLEALKSYEILDTLPESAFDELVHLASEICNVPIALMSLIDRERQWFKSAVGLGETETPRDHAFCAHAILQDDVFAVPDAAEDSRFADNPLVTSGPHIRFYAGSPLATRAGLKLGTLCVIDRVPRHLNDFQKRALQTLGAQVVAHLELRVQIRDLAKRAVIIRTQRDSLDLLQRQKDELASLIVHDLKNPLAAILSNAQFTLENTLSEQAREAVIDIEASARAMKGLVTNLLDVSRGDEGMLVPEWGEVRIGELVNEVRKLTRRRAEDRKQQIVVTGQLANEVVRADADLLRRVVENLIDNALRYTSAASPGAIEIALSEPSEELVDIAVKDRGPGVPAAYRETIFERYARIENGVPSFTRSRGLGLTFCRLAVEAHGGTISVHDNAPQGSVFRVRLPRAGLR
jgi:signal transduction histidine kinase